MQKNPDREDQPRLFRYGFYGIELPVVTVKPSRISGLKYHPVTSKRWGDLEKLFGERGACGGCWCMWWRLKRSEFERQKGKKNKQALKNIVDSGKIPGIIAYKGKEPVAWCSIAPREEFPVLDRSRTLKRIDDKPVWSVVCFFITKPYRRKGISVKLLEAALEYARKHGADIVEGYPLEPKKEGWPDAFVWTGLPQVFDQAGFVEVLRRSKTRPIMRYYFEK